MLLPRIRNRPSTPLLSAAKWQVAIDTQLCAQGSQARADSKSCGYCGPGRLRGHRVCGFSLCGRSLRRHRSKRGHNLDSSDEELVPLAPDATPLQLRKNRENQRKRPIYLPYPLHEPKNARPRCKIASCSELASGYAAKRDVTCAKRLPEASMLSRVVVALAPTA